MAHLELTTAGESHGPALLAVATGLPSGLAIDQGFLAAQLARRQAGYGRSPRQRLETDVAHVVGGLRHGRTMGSPVALRVDNRDHANWSAAMAPWPTDEQQGNWRDRPITLPRPGHADLGGIARGGFEEDGLRPVLERASARETAARVAGGALAQCFLAELGIRVRGHVRRVGDAASARPTPDELDPAWDALDTSYGRTVDSEADLAMVAEIDAAKAARDTLGGIVEVVVWGCPPGIGGYATTRERLDGRLAGAALSVQAMKAVEFGDGLALGSLRGSEAHDEIHPFDQAAGAAAPPGALGGDQGMGVTRRTNHAGGIEGGMTNGAPIVVRIAMKPLPTLMRPLASVDLATGEAAAAHAERSDVCAIAAAAVVLETVVAFALAQTLREQFGSQSMADVSASYVAYRERVAYPDRGIIELPGLAAAMEAPAT